MKTVSASGLLILALAGIMFSTGCARKAAMDPVATESSQQEKVSAIPETSDNSPDTDALAQVVQDSQVQKDEELFRIDLERVHFDYDQYTLSSKARSTLKENAQVLLRQPNVRIRVEGHCDSRGSDEYNLALGDRRAQAVKNFLVALGVPADRLETNSYGEEMPLEPANSEVAWAKNRRAELKRLN